MTKNMFFLVVLITIGTMLLSSPAVQAEIDVTTSLSKMPLSFTENQGKWDDKVQFRANAGGATMWFGPDGAYYQFTRTIPVGKSQEDIPPDLQADWNRSLVV